ncbi:universal stress protein [Gangjinia marincola]|uniref:Universal stress protein n=1 Tax=Gangjinia marincola TaxID=578463 RepID=A0ABN1MEN1_9FLAO
MKKILVPTDFSPEAENALQVAAHLAKKHNAEIYLTHMLDLPMDLIDPMSDGSASDLPEAIFFMKLARKRFDEILSKDYLQGISVHETVDFYDAFDGIIAVSQEKECDVIIMGSRGASGLREIFIGSNTEKVVRQSPIPVMVIKNEHKEKFDIQKFVFATGFNMDTVETCRAAKAFAENLNASFEILSINISGKFKTSGEIQERINTFLVALGDTNVKVTIYNDKSIEKGIIHYANDNAVDMVGISTHGRKGIAHFFNASLSQSMVNHAKRPVVTFKINAESA